MEIKTRFQSKNKWHSQRIQKKCKNKHHNSNYIGHSVNGQSLHNYCNQFTKNTALKKRNRPHDSTFVDYLHKDYAGNNNKSNNIIPCWTCNRCTYYNIERSSHCTICQLPFTSKSANVNQNQNQNKVQKNEHNNNAWPTLDEYITPLLTQKQPKFKTEYLTEDDIDESVQIAIALSLSSNNYSDFDDVKSQDSNRSKYSNDDLLAQRHKYQEMPEAASHIEDIFAPGLGLNTDFDDVKTQETRSKYSKDQLLAQRHKYQAMPDDASHIEGIFAPGLGRNDKDNNEINQISDIKYDDSAEHEKDADELYWDEMVEIFEKMKAVKATKKKKKMTGNKKKQEDENDKKKSAEEVNLARYIGQYPELCEQIKRIEQIRHNLEGHYNRYTFNIQCILNANVAKKFLNSRGDHVGKLDLVYHGTDAKNNDSIKQRGLIAGGTNGVERVHGAAYGKGVYCSPHVNTAGSYVRGSMFICLVRSHQVKRSGMIWVVPSDCDILPLYLAEFDFNNYNCSFKAQKDGPDFVPILKGTKEWYEAEFNEFQSFPEKGQEIFKFYPCFKPLNREKCKDKQRKVRRKWSAYYKLNDGSRK